MCGIFFSIAKGKPAEPTDEHLGRLQARGPDSTNTVSTSLTCNGERYNIHALSTVLSLRGVKDDPAQPLVSNRADTNATSLLCWNGEAYSIGTTPVTGHDTSIVFDALLSACERDFEQTSFPNKTNCMKTLHSIRGPFAFVFVDGVNGRLFFGRDCLGRRSLLSRATMDCLTIASVSDSSSEYWYEVDVDPTGTNDTKILPNHLLENACSGLGQHSVVATDLPSEGRSRLIEQSGAVRQLEQELRCSIALRVAALKPLLNGDGPTERPRIAVLFSGGIDCTLIARILHDHLPPAESIDLLNVAFENPRIHSTPEFSKKGIHFSDACPDRMTAMGSFSELQAACPTRVWRLVKINIPFTETEAHRHTITSLMVPHNTEMDLSIATALYFAARGQGYVYESTPYTTPARVLLSGLGADELFGGYARHEQAFKRGGHETLIDELQLDVSRLGKRNLGRDDRVLSHWGRETRFPYLDEHFVDWAVSLPIWEKAGFGIRPTSTVDGRDSNLEDGKLILRLLARKLGLPGAAREKKRAIQFGARTAKMQSGRSRGTDSILP